MEANQEEILSVQQPLISFLGGFDFLYIARSKIKARFPLLISIAIVNLRSDHKHDNCSLLLDRNLRRRCKITRLKPFDRLVPQKLLKVTQKVVEGARIGMSRCFLHVEVVLSCLVVTPIRRFLPQTARFHRGHQCSHVSLQPFHHLM